MDVKKLDENKIYWLDNNECISIYLSNKPTGERNSLVIWNLGPPWK